MSDLNTTIFDKVPPECRQKDSIDDINDGHAGDVDAHREHDHPQHGVPLDLGEEDDCDVNVQPDHQILSHEKKKKYLAELNSRCRGLYQVIRQSVQVAKA